MFLIKSFWYMTKKSREKPKYLENGKSFWGKIKRIFPHFKGFSVAKNCLRPKSAPLSLFLICSSVNFVHMVKKGKTSRGTALVFQIL